MLLCSVLQTKNKDFRDLREEAALGRVALLLALLLGLEGSSMPGRT